MKKSKLTAAQELPQLKASLKEVSDSLETLRLKHEALMETVNKNTELVEQLHEELVERLTKALSMIPKRKPMFTKASTWRDYLWLTVGVHALLQTYQRINLPK